MLGGLAKSVALAFGQRHKCNPCVAAVAAAIPSAGVPLPLLSVVRQLVPSVAVVIDMAQVPSVVPLTLLLARPVMPTVPHAQAKH